MEIKIALPGVKLGIVEADEVRVVSADPELAKLMDEVCARKRREFTVETLAESEPVRAVRAMFREWGMDPSKYRPSSEALLRRVVQGKGLYRVSNVVDIGNLGSHRDRLAVRMLRPRRKLARPSHSVMAPAGEKYEGIGKQIWHLEGRPVLADPQGPFGSPISDSTRSMITESATQVMIVIYAPARTTDSALECGDGKAEGPADAIRIGFGYALRYLYSLITLRLAPIQKLHAFVQDNVYFAPIPFATFENFREIALSC